MTREEAIQVLHNIANEEAGKAITASGFYRTVLEYHVEALHIAMACLQHELDREEKDNESKS